MTYVIRQCFVGISTLVLLGVPSVPAQSPIPAAPNVEKAGEAPSFERLENGDIRLGKITLHREQRVLSFTATLVLDRGALEVLIATPIGRLHESLLKSEAQALHLQTMLYLLDLTNGARLATKEGVAQGSIVDIDLEWQQENGEKVTEPVEGWVLDARTGKQMERHGWVFVGSSLAGGEFLADTTGNLVLLYSLGDTVLDTAEPAGDDDTLFVANEARTQPGVGKSVRVIITPRKAPQAEDTRIRDE